MIFLVLLLLRTDGTSGNPELEASEISDDQTDERDLDENPCETVEEDFEELDRMPFADEK